MIADLINILVGIALTVGTFMFVSAEFSFVALDHASVEKEIRQKNRRAPKVLHAIRTLSTQLSGTQVGITLTTILLGYTTQTAIAHLLTRVLSNAGLANTLATTLAVTISTIVINVVSMFFGELVPKNMALAHPMKTASAVVTFQLAFTWLFRPIIFFLNGTANFLLHRMGIEPQEEISSARSASEMSVLVRHSADEGALDKSLAALLMRSIHLSDLYAVDVMTDRGLMCTLSDNATANDVIALARETGHSRFPVIGEDSDDVIGIVSLRRAVAVPWEKRSEVPVTASSLMADASRIPETLQIAPLLVQLRDGGLQMAVVVDEYGGVSGIVTLEDVVEEIVGEVKDEHDTRRKGIRRQTDGSLLVPGRLRPDELFTYERIRFPDDGPYETLAGLFMTELGDVPSVNDSVCIGDYQLKVDHMKGRRITLLSVKRINDLPEGDKK